MQQIKLTASATIRSMIIRTATALPQARLVEPGGYSLTRVAGTLISPVLDEIVPAGKDDHPLISNPDKGWHLLQEKQLDDLTDKDSNAVLPIQLARAPLGFAGIAIRNNDPGTLMQRFKISKTNRYLSK